MAEFTFTDQVLLSSTQIDTQGKSHPSFNEYLETWETLLGT